LSISVGALLLPAAYHFAISGGKDSGSFEQKDDILKMSYGVRFVSTLLELVLIDSSQVSIILMFSKS
jgi:Ca2+:H+ antiporter